MLKNALGWLVSKYLVNTPLHRGKVRITQTAFRLLPRVPVRGAFGNRMLSVPDNTSVRSILGTYGAVFDCVNQLQPGMAFIDVGANAGVFSLFASDRVGATGRVVAFEPASETFQLLIRNIELNHSQRIVPINAAIGEETRIVRFNPASPAHSGKAHIDEAGAVEVLQLGAVELTPILTATIGDRATIVKIDVEGAELLVVRGLTPFLRSANVTIVVAEVNAEFLARFGTTEDQLFDAMRQLGFEVGARSNPRAHYDQVFVRALPERSDLPRP